MKTWITFILGLLVGILTAFLFAAGYFELGFAPVAVKASPIPFETVFAHAALHATTARAASDVAPFEVTEARLLAGAHRFRKDCAVCHGLPGGGKTDFQKGMAPQPPELLSGKGVTDDPVGETHWVIQNGIRMTGMPSFEGTLSDEQIWELGLLLKQAHDLPVSVMQLLNEPIEHESPGIN